MSKRHLNFQRMKLLPLTPPHRRVDASDQTIQDVHGDRESIYASLKAKRALRAMTLALAEEADDTDDECREPVVEVSENQMLSFKHRVEQLDHMVQEQASQLQNVHEMVETRVRERLVEEQRKWEAEWAKKNSLNTLWASKMQTQSARTSSAARVKELEGILSVLHNHIRTQDAQLDEAKALVERAIEERDHTLSLLDSAVELAEFLDRFS